MKKKRNLYDQYGYPDNYTDDSFLDELQKNINFKEITLLEAVSGSGLIAREMSVVVLFSILFYYLYNSWLEAETVFIHSTLVTAACYLIYCNLFKKSMERNSFQKDLQIVLTFLVFGQVLSPVMHTLTDTISTDTICAMAVIMMIIHLVFFDYQVDMILVSKALPLNAAMFASVCLASRLSSPFHAFVLLTVAVECFVLLPLLLSRIKSILLSLSFTVVALFFLWSLSSILTILFGSFLIFVTLICPYYYVKCQKYKENIYGPWDEAVVDDAEL